MKLPSDTDKWTKRHLTKLVNMMFSVFDKYEKYVGVNQKKADFYYSSYLGLSKQRDNLCSVLAIDNKSLLP